MNKALYARTAHCATAFFLVLSVAAAAFGLGLARLILYSLFYNGLAGFRSRCSRNDAAARVETAASPTPSSAA